MRRVWSPIGQRAGQAGERARQANNLRRCVGRKHLAGEQCERERAVRNAKAETGACAAIAARRTALVLARGFRQFASVLEVVKAKPCSPCSSRSACT